MGPGLWYNFWRQVLAKMIRINLIEKTNRQKSNGRFKRPL